MKAVELQELVGGALQENSRNRLKKWLTTYRTSTPHSRQRER